MGAPTRKHKPTKTRDDATVRKIRDMLRREHQRGSMQMAKRRPSSVDVVDADVVKLMPFAHGQTKSIFTDRQQEILGAAARDDELDVRPDNGAVYMPHAHIRRRFDKAFGIGGWRMVPAPGPDGALQKREGRRSETEVQKQQLWIGTFANSVAEAVGFAGYYPLKPAMDYGDALRT